MIEIFFLIQRQTSIYEYISTCVAIDYQNLQEQRDWKKRIFQGTNGRALYRILYDDVNINVFSINQDSGEIILQNNIDEDEYRHFVVIVEAKDLGSPQPLASVARVYVTVVDENDNQPVFDKSSYRYVFFCASLCLNRLGYIIAGRDF